jgi:protocatechuate 3,4-dioxygenase beta subunit
MGSAAFLAACASPDQMGTALPAPGSTQSLPTQVVATQIAPTAGSPLDCVVRPEMTIGPYFVDQQLNRSDIRTNSADNVLKEGLPLTLHITIASVGNNSCTPIEGAQVDIWHCDAQGQYSGVSDRGFETTGQDFLRGYQLAKANGVVQFQTIYPGWYSGRAVHIHFTIRTRTADGQDYQFTSQFFFDDALTDQVHAQEPYASRGQRDTLNAGDHIFRSGGDQLLLNLQGDITSGYTGSMNIGLDLTDIEVGAADSMGGRP